MRDITALIKRSLSVLENPVVRNVLVLLLVLYSAGVLPTLNRDVSVYANNMWVRLLVLVVIMCVSVKDVALALLLAVAFILTVHMSNGMEEGLEGAPISMEEHVIDHAAPVEEGFDDEEEGSPSGYNPVDGDQPCLTDCASGSEVGGQGSGNCSATATWENESNAQGMNCPMGFGGDELAQF